MPVVVNPGERRHALRYKPAIAVRAAYEWLDAGPVSLEGAITDFSYAGLALQYAEEWEPERLAARGRVCLKLGQESEDFEVKLARVVPWSSGSWLAGLSFRKRGDWRSRAGRVIERLKSAYRAGAVQAAATGDGVTARVVGTLNFHVVISLHRLMRGPQPPRSVDLRACTGADQSGITFLMMAREQGIDLRFGHGGRVAELIERHRASGPHVPGAGALLLPA